MKTQIIIFSKNRTLQLKSLLRSLKYYSDIEESEISVLYTTEPDIPYEPLIAEFKCNFVRQQSFFDDLEGLVEKSDSRYISFMVDDLIFRDDFSLRRVEEFLDRNQDVDCFSLRLGTNIEDESQPPFVTRDGDILVWDTAAGLPTKSWKFFWEISSSIYRIDLVREYLHKCDPRKVTFPNPFESHYYACMPSYVVGRSPDKAVRNKCPVL